MSARACSQSIPNDGYQESCSARREHTPDTPSSIDG